MNKKLSPKVVKLLGGAVLMVGIVDFLLQINFRRAGIGVNNTGISFGFLDNGNSVLSIVLLGILSLVIIFLLMGAKSKKISIWAILVGGLVNLLSRVFFGGVWDYLFIPFMPFGNNLSDILISTGVIFYILGF